MNRRMKIFLRFRKRQRKEIKHQRLIYLGRLFATELLAVADRQSFASLILGEK